MTPKDEQEFEEWWAKHGQFCRSGGGEYEKTFAYRAWERQADRFNFIAERQAAKYRAEVAEKERDNYKALRESRAAPLKQCMAENVELHRKLAECTGLRDAYVRLADELRLDASNEVTELMKQRDILVAALKVAERYLVHQVTDDAGYKFLQEAEGILIEMENRRD